MSDPCTIHVALVTVDVFIPESQSLKDKRMVLKSIKDRLHNNFNISVSEAGGQDKWQAGTLALTMVGTDRKYMDGGLQQAIQFIEACDRLQITDYKIQYI